jgi:ribosome biogenesis protein BRX1
MVPEICEMKNCNNCIYFEMRKKQDLYAWVGKMPHGPSCKFLVQNIHTMDELKMSGNALKGSRPLLNFDAAFDLTPDRQLLKEILFQSFGTPRSHPKSKAFVDRMMSFFWMDERVWVRNYQIAWSEDKANPDDHELVEIGPRFVMQPIRIFNGPFGGKTLFENEEFVSPNEYRRKLKAEGAQKFLDRTAERAQTEARKKTNVMEEAEIDTVFHDAAAAAAE